ncbi:MAG: outer membrane efflux [Geobacteraceae bacterium]|nr:MAG: outer membrane efflux [Geobacteraceae bacterium]
MKSYYGTLAVFLLMVLCCAGSGFAAEPGREKLVLDLKECIGRAIAVAPELGEAQADVELTASKLEEAKSHRYPQIEILGLTGPIPQARGDQVSSPDKINQTDRWTWFERGDATLIQPLYTFGKISESMKAAGHGIEVDLAKKEQRRNEVALKVKEYYYGLLLARELKELVLEVQEDLAEAREKAVKLLDEGSPNVEELDIYKLDAFAGEVGKYLEEARKGEALALTALRSRLGLPPDAELDIATERLLPGEEKVGELSAYLETAQSRRPEYRQIREGLRARGALVEAARAAWYPDFFVAGYLSGANAEKRDKVVNPWVPDDYNHLWGGVALGLKWRIDFGITGAKVAGERAQYNRLLSTKEYAEANIPLQIRKYYLDCREAEKSAEKTRDGYSSAKKWAVAAIANFDFGIGPAKEIFDALQQYAKMRAAYFQSIYNFKVAQANLAYATGGEPL